MAGCPETVGSSHGQWVFVGELHQINQAVMNRPNCYMNLRFTQRVKVWDFPWLFAEAVSVFSQDYKRLSIDYIGDKIEMKFRTLFLQEDGGTEDYEIPVFVCHI